MSDTIKVSIRREFLPIKDKDGQIIQRPWTVRCTRCKNAHEPFRDLFGGPGLVAWTTARNISLAIDWAHKHAREHEAERCATCHHVPKRDLTPGKHKAAA